MNKPRVDFYIDKQIHNFDRTVKKYSDDHWCYRILFSAILISPESKKLKTFWQSRTASKWIDIAIKKDILFGGKLDFDIFNPQTLGVGLKLGAALMRGFIDRIPSK